MPSKTGVWNKTRNSSEQSPSPSPASDQALDILKACRPCCHEPRKKADCFEQGGRPGGQVFSIFGLTCAIFLFATSSGCALNSFQANMTLEPKPSASADHSQRLSSNKIVILVHGLYGDDKSFGNLGDLLLQDKVLQVKSVYVAEYWSSRIFPNFQRLADLGATLEEHLDSIASENPTAELIVIAHSQGGLIARHAILAMRDKHKDGVLSRMKLIMIGTPNYPSLYATYNSLIVNSISAPAAYLSALFTMGRMPPPIYNRQAFDMAISRLNPFTSDHMETRDELSPFMENMILRWAREFPTGANDNPKAYAIIGIKNLLGHYDLSDGVVHSLSTLFAGIPEQRVHYVPYSHFGAEAEIEDDSHHSYKAIKTILLELREPVRNAQRLSPFPTFPISQVLLVMQHEPLQREPKSTKIDRVMMWSSLSPIERKPLPDVVGKAIRRPDLLSVLGRTIYGYSMLPFFILHDITMSTASYWDEHHSQRPAWLVPRGQSLIELTDEEANGRIYTSRVEKGEKSWWWQEKTKEAEIDFRIATSTDSADAQCRIEYVVNWGGAEGSTDVPKVTAITSKLSLARNSMNFVKVDIMRNESPLQDMLVLSTGDCIDR